MKLKVGDTIPTLWTRDTEDKVVDSKKFKGYTLIVFLRYAGCPFCNLAILRLTHEYKLLKRDGCDIVAFVASDQANIEKNIMGRNNPKPPFSLVADRPGDFFSLFGVEQDIIGTAKYSAKHAAHWFDSVINHDFKWQRPDGDAFTVPAYFLIDEKQVVQQVDYAANFYDDETFTKIYEHLTFHRSISVKNEI